MPVRWRADPAACGRVAALTFDDGPHPVGTPLVLDALAERGVPATFFLIGEHAERHPGIVRRIHDAGHLLGNHSHRHGHADALRGRRFWRGELTALQRRRRGRRRRAADCSSARRWA